MIEKLLENQALQSAIIALIVVLLNHAAAWVHRKTSYAKIVDDNWDYLLPILQLVTARIKAVKTEGGDDKNRQYRVILGEAMEQFVEQYTLYEGAKPTANEVAAVQNEIGTFVENQAAK